MPRPKRPEQLYLDGTAPPRDEDIEQKLESWLDATDAKTAASEDTKLCHQVLLATLQERGVAAYPYRDRSTGEKRLVKIKAGEPKVCTAKAPRPERLDREKDMAGESSAATRHDLTETAETAYLERREAELDEGKRSPDGLLDSERETTVQGNGNTVDVGGPPVGFQRITLDADPFASVRSSMTPAQIAALESDAARESRRRGKGSSS